MKYNERELARSSEEKTELEGRLNYKKINMSSQYYQSSFKQRWFKLIDNFLFYFRINEGVIEKQPMGAFVIEGATIRVEKIQESPFAFSIIFLFEPDKKYIFSCMSEPSLSLWISKLHSSSYEYLRSQLYVLQSKIFTKTGKDPLLLVPRNAGSMKWAPGQPLPDGNELEINKNGFTSHISSTKNFDKALHKSKSSTNVNNDININFSKTDQATFLELSWPGIEKSKTSVEIFQPCNTIDEIKNYHRPAPSPPPRKRNSPLLPRNITNNVVKKNGHNDFLQVDSSISNSPTPPARRNSPKRNNVNKTVDVFDAPVNTENVDNCTNEIDLIQF